MEISEKLYVGDVVEMRKVHPCGGRDWKIDRVGADIGLVCQTLRATRVTFAAQACARRKALCCARR